MKIPLIFEFTVLGKATKMVGWIKCSPPLMKYYSTYGPKTIVFEFDSQEEKDRFKSAIERHVHVRRLIRTHQMKIF